MKSSLLTHTLNLLIVSLLFPATLLAQNNQEIASELEIMKEALKQVFLSSNPQPSIYHCKTSSLSATYQPGFGIILTAPTYMTSSRYNFQFRGGESVPAPSVAPSSGEAEKSQQAMLDAVVDNMRFFLQNYGDLAYGLDNEEKILVIYEGSNTQVASRFQTQGLTFSLDDKANAQITAQVQKSEIEAFRKQKLTEAQLQERIDVEFTETQEDADPSFKILANILNEQLKNLASKDEPMENVTVSGAGSNSQLLALTSTLRILPKVTYKVVKGLGVTYEVSLRSRNTFFPVAAVAGTQKDNSTNEGEASKDNANDLDEKIDEQYEHLKLMLQEDLVKYGRTLRALEATEFVTIKLTNAPCNACEAPATLTLSIKVEDLQKYDRREIDLDETISRIAGTEAGSASDLRTGTWRVAPSRVRKNRSFGGNEE